MEALRVRELRIDLRCQVILLVYAICPEGVYDEEEDVQYHRLLDGK